MLAWNVGGGTEYGHDAGVWAIRPYRYRGTYNHWVVEEAGNKMAVISQYLTVRSFLDQFQTLPYNSLIFGTLVQSDGNSTAHGWVHGAGKAKSRRTVTFQKRRDFKSLPNVENRRKNERTVTL